MIGRVLGGRYEILEAIDSGGMAYVYKALCHKTDKTVAVKILKQTFSNNPDYVKRFKKEAQSAFSLEHENIIHVSDIGCDDGIYYMVMEYVQGSTLKALIDKNGRIAERDAILYAIQICSALSAAHKRGIIHRDIKPQNILIDKTKTAKVTDFGIAKSLSATDEEEKEVIGSVYYVSPEQARGDNVDARTDIYSMGIMLYELLTGELPYKGDQTVSVALKHINEKITAPVKINPNLSKSINNIVLKATSKNKKDRYRSMDAFKEDLVRAIVDKSGEYIELPYEHQTVDAPVIIKKFKIWRVVVLIAILAFLAASVITVVSILDNTSVQTIKMPDFEGQAVSDASKTLTNLGLVVKLEFEQSETITVGKVMAQTPISGSAVIKGSTVTLTIANGPAGLSMPDVTGMTLDEAKDLIASMGLTIEIITYEYSKDLPANTVITQAPDADSEVNADNPISIVVSADQQEMDMPMPPVNGNMVDQTVASLHEAGFTNCFVYESTESELNEGTVVDQDPQEGIVTSYDHEIDIWISPFKQKDYHAQLTASADVPDKDSKIKIVLLTKYNDVPLNLVVSTYDAPNSGRIPIGLDIPSTSGGTKTVKVYVNNVEAYSVELEFTKRDTE